MEAVGQLAGGVAHDFNNILASMMLNLDLMKMDERLPEDLRNSLAEQEREAARAAALTRQLLLFGRRQVISLKPVELNAALHNVLGMISRIIGETIRIELSRGAPELWIHADEGMIGQIVMNLCVNARDAMPKGGVISILTEAVEVDSLAGHRAAGARLGGFVCIRIKDTGVGMSPEVLRHAFEPFFTTKAPGKGTGLGLATVHGIVQQHNGWVEVATSPGMGTEFSIYLPATQRDERRAAENAAVQTPRGGHETILVVEDEPGLRTGICNRLSRLGYRVLEASNAQDALERWGAQAASIDLLFTDMVMAQGMNGNELSAAFRALKPGIKVIISSGYSQDLLKAGDLEKAGIVYLPKPYAGDVLTGLIRSQLDGAAQAR
jgi:CheY-like chemotaxis protein